MAAEDLQNSRPTLKCVANNTSLRYFENNAFREDLTKDLSNPAWSCLYALKIANVKDEYINYPEFQIWADYCIEEELECNIILDSMQDLSSALALLSPLGFATVVQKGMVWTPLVDRPVEAASRKFLLTRGNITEDSFSIDYIDYSDRANVIELTYYDKKKGYASTTIRETTKNFHATSREVKVSINRYGCVSKEQAYKEVRRLIKKNEKISKTVTLGTSIEGLAGEVGKVINVGYEFLTDAVTDGRLTATTGNTLTIDNEITFEAGKNYNIDIKDQDTDEVYKYQIANTQDTTDQITLTNNSESIQFKKDDIYKIYESEFSETDLFRIEAITSSMDFDYQIIAEEYIPEVYIDDADLPESIVYTPSEITSNLKVEEMLIQRRDGGVDEVLVLSWQSNKLSNDIFIDGKKIGTSNNNIFEIKNELVRGRTYDIFVNEIGVTYTYEGRLADVEPVKNLSISLKATNTILSWNKVAFASGYRIYHNEVLVEEKINATTFNYELLSSGSHTFKIEALNIGNEPSIAVEQTVTVEVPLSPDVNVLYKDENIILQWKESDSTYPIKHYIIKHDDIETVSKTTTYSTKVLWLDNEITIQAEDIVGNKSTIRTAQSNIQVPSVSNLRSKVIDNNILLYWNKEQKTLPIKEIEIRKGDENDIYETSEYIGNRVGTFTELFETIAGYYTYWFTPIDSAGNRGEKSSTTAFMNEPPDYVLNVQWYSKFDGTLEKCVVDSRKLFMGIINETFENHFLTNSWTTPQSQIDAGYPLYAQPFDTASYYEEVFDYEAILGSTGVTVVLDYENIGNSSFTVDISISIDGITYIKYENQSKIIDRNFRYVKVRVTSTSDDKGIFVINQMEVRLDSKLKNDGGKGTALANDSAGTVVNFNKEFTDITSITVTAKGTSARNPVYDFEDVPNPTFFKVYAFDSNGNRISSDFSWSVKGY
jgi:hypothetical protein